MPRGDGTGPPGGGRRGAGRGAGGGARGRMGGFALGPGGNCVCLKCGRKVPHQQGVPCPNLTCPNCGTPMSRART